MIACVTDAADLGVEDAAEALALASAVLAGARRGMSRPHPCARRHTQPPRRPGLGERVGAGLRGGRDRRGRPCRRASRGGRRAPALRDPDRPQRPLRRRREAAHRLEPGARRGGRPGLRRLGEPLAGGDGPARTPAHARVRLRRHHRPGRQSLVTRALGGRLERRLRRGARIEPGAGGDRHRHRARCASPRRSAGRRRSSRRAGSSRSAGSCRWRRPSTIPGR